MAASIGQYAPVFSPGEPPPWQRGLAGHSLQGWKGSNTTEAALWAQTQELFSLWQFWPSESWAWRWCSCLTCRDPGGEKCAGTRTASATGVRPYQSLCQASCNRRVEGLFGLSFPIAPPIQALRGPSCLGSFSVVWCIRHIEGPPWMESYSVDWCLRHFKGHPGWGPTL